MLRDGARRAFVAELHAQTANDLHRYLTQRLGSAEAAEDVAQEAYAKMLALEHPETIRNQRAFLFKVASRLALNYIRDNQHTNADWQAVPFDEGEHAAADTWQPERATAGREALETVVAELAAMPKRSLEVFLLHRFGGYTYGQISDQLGISRKTVEYHMTRTLKRLMTGRGDIADSSDR